ncbi:M16 family metallopeptidase [Nonomuraea sediminis]|uniref:M16 family metallopeptidase n=1 Tax=Nonomuraea sediminis TaxID=2835864 RepID=UPI001BDD8171|nr:pitrilysin family protein [Nonomuraea sediminis]
MPREAVLSNGLRVLAVERRHTGVAAVSIRYAAGSCHEPPRRTGLAHVTEHLMYRRGDVAALEGMGALYDADTWFEHTVYYQTVPSGRLEQVLRLEAGRGLADALRVEREVVRNEVRQRLYGLPYGTHLPHLIALCHPFGHTPAGTEEDLDAITPEDCAAFVADRYTPGNAVLAMVGDFDADAALDLADRIFSGVPGKPPPPSRPYGTARGGTRLEVSERQPAEALYVAHLLPSAGLDSAEAAVRLLAQGEGSRLHRRLVVDQGTALSVEADFHRFSTACSMAIVKIHAAPGASLEAVEQAVVEETAELAASGARPGELDRVFALTRREHLERVATAAGLANELTLHGRAPAAPVVVEPAADLLVRDRNVLAYRLEES